MPRKTVNLNVFRDLVWAALYMHWESYQEENERNGDCSYRDAIEAARAELERFGILTPSIEQMRKGIDKILGITPV